MTVDLIWFFLIPLFLVSVYYLYNDKSIKWKTKSRRPNIDPDFFTVLYSSDFLS